MDGGGCGGGTAAIEQVEEGVEGKGGGVDGEDEDLRDLGLGTIWV